jgi:two-component system nitrogen regulation response regulator NtrX
MELILAYDWPGNVRELKNFAERIAVMHRGGRVTRKLTEEFLRQARPGEPAGGASPFPIEEILKKTYSEAKDFFEKYYLEYQLFRNHGIISKTAESIGMYPSNLHAKVKKFRITVPAGKE